MNNIAIQVFGRIHEMITWVFFKYFCRGEIINLENLPDTPYIIAANHVSYMDWIILYSVFRKVIHQDVIFLAKRRLFMTKYLCLLVKYGKSICVDQEKVSKDLIKSIYCVIEEKKIFGIFPEGKRSENGKLLKAFPGVARIMMLADVPVVPIGLNGFFEILPKGKRIPKIKKCNITIGEPIFLKQSAIGKTDKMEELEQNTRLIMTKIAELTNQKYNY